MSTNNEFFDERAAETLVEAIKKDIDPFFHDGGAVEAWQTGLYRFAVSLNIVDEEFWFDTLADWQRQQPKIQKALKKYHWR